MADTDVKPFKHIITQKYLKEHEFRTIHGKIDPLFSRLHTCRDKTWYALYKDCFTKEEISEIMLHSLCVSIDFCGDEFVRFSMKDWAEHQLFDYHFEEGTTEEKIKAISSLIDKGIPVFVGTIHPLLPFSKYYNSTISLNTYEYPNHVFVILGIERNNYIYFDTSSVKTPRYNAWRDNPELGIFDKQEMDNILKKMFYLSWVEWKNNSIVRGKYGDKIIQEYLNHVCMEEIDGGCQRYMGYDAIRRIGEYLRNGDGLDSPSEEYSFIPQKEIFQWRLQDIADRRYLFAEWLLENIHYEEAHAVKRSYAAWQSLCNVVNYCLLKDKSYATRMIPPLINHILMTEKEAQVSLQRIMHIPKPESILNGHIEQAIRSERARFPEGRSTL